MLSLGYPFHVGPQKVLISAKAYDALETKRTLALAPIATTIQKTFRGYFARQTLSQVRKTMRALETAITKKDVEACAAGLRSILGLVPDSHPLLARTRAVIQTYEEQVCFFVAFLYPFGVVRRRGGVP